MIWNVLGFIACVGCQYMLTVGMAEPGRSTMRWATWVNVVALGVPLFVAIALSGLGVL